MIVESTTTNRLKPIASPTRPRRRRAELRDGDPKAWRLEHGSLGWLTAVRRASGCANQEHLTIHADWRGPVKLVRDHQAMFERLDVYLATPAWSEIDRALDEGASDDRQQLLDVLTDAVGRFPAADADLASWQPPPSETIAAWLAAEGRTAAADPSGNLHLAIARPGCDGQVCLQAQPGRMQMSITLGTWQSLAPSAEAALLRLADETNTRTRLVRIAWLPAAGTQRCVAQVDLTGLPSFDPDSPANCAMWRGMIEMGLAGLEVVLKRLGRELAILAHTAYADLARTVAEEDG